MNAIQQLRAKVDLPENYRVKMPVSERKKILRSALSACRVNNAIRKQKIGNKPPEKVRQARAEYIAAGARFSVVSRFINYGPLTIFEINKDLGLGAKKIRSQVWYLIKIGLVEKTERKRLIGGRHLAIYEVTEAGRLYAEKINVG